jgi:hypothetical protein
MKNYDFLLFRSKYIKNTTRQHFLMSTMRVRQKGEPSALLRIKGTPSFQKGEPSARNALKGTPSKRRAVSNPLKARRQKGEPSIPSRLLKASRQKGEPSIRQGRAEPSAVSGQRASRQSQAEPSSRSVNPNRRWASRVQQAVKKETPAVSGGGLLVAMGYRSGYLLSLITSGVD